MIVLSFNIGSDLMNRKSEHRRLDIRMYDTDFWEWRKKRNRFLKTHFDGNRVC